MAFKKKLTLPNGAAGEYIVVNGHFTYDHQQRYFSAEFLLYVSEGAAKAKPQHALGTAAYLRLEGDKFDEYVSKKALAETDRDIFAQIYFAAKRESVTSDHGERAFWDAEDV